MDVNLTYDDQLSLQQNIERLGGQVDKLIYERMRKRELLLFTLI
jgi:hypothetical protein